MTEEHQWKELADFHFNQDIGLPEKANLYITGIAALGVQFMNETNATSFEVKSVLPHRQSGKKYRAIFKLQEV